MASMQKLMDYGIKISKKDYDVLRLDLTVQAIRQKKEIAHILALLALPYVLGGMDQVIRYQSVALTLKSKPRLGTLGCLHEISNLFEDLNCVTIYMRKCKLDHRDHDTWVNIRNYFRHSIRDGFDKNDELNEVIARKLGIDVRLQINIGFDLDAVKIGSTIVEMSRIINYLKWAENNINSILDKAKIDGRISE